jgi:hypothetical protein
LTQIKPAPAQACGHSADGTIHDFMLLNPIASTPPVRGAVDQTSEYLREVFVD